LYGRVENFCSVSADHGNVEVQFSKAEVQVVEVSTDRIGYPAGYLRFFRIRIGLGYSFLKKIGSGQDQDIGLISITKFSSE